MTINRREMITGTAALLGSTHLSLAMGALQREKVSADSTDTNLAEKPKNLLCSTFTPELLSRSLIAASDWHPYPKVAERKAWDRVPREVADAAVARAEKIRGTKWESLPATTFLEYKRDGNRSHFESYYLDRRVRLCDLVLGECVQGRGKFLDEIVNGIWLECEETFWGLPAHLFLQRTNPGSGLPDVERSFPFIFSGLGSRPSAGAWRRGGVSSSPADYWAALCTTTDTYWRVDFCSNTTTPAAVANKVWSVPMPTLRPGWNFVPRWRTRMLPPSTCSPPNFFTPRRRPSESRPLRDEPPAFL